MNFVMRLLLMATIATLSGCTGMKVSSAYDSSANFGGISTYQWINPPSEILDEDDTYLNEGLQKALNNELAARGWKQVLEASETDIQVVYYIKLKEQLEYAAANEADHEFSGGFVYNRNQSNWIYEKREPDLNIYTVEVGTLAVLIYDAKTGDRIWRGSIQSKLDRSKPIEKQRDLFRSVSQKLLDRIP